MHGARHIARDWPDSTFGLPAVFVVGERQLCCPRELWNGFGQGAGYAEASYMVGRTNLVMFMFDPGLSLVIS